MNCPTTPVNRQFNMHMQRQRRQLVARNFGQTTKRDVTSSNLNSFNQNINEARLNESTNLQNISQTLTEKTLLQILNRVFQMKSGISTMQQEREESGNQLA